MNRTSVQTDTLRFRFNVDRFLVMIFFFILNFTIFTFTFQTIETWAYFFPARVYSGHVKRIFHGRRSTCVPLAQPPGSRSSTRAYALRSLPVNPIIIFLVPVIAAVPGRSRVTAGYSCNDFNRTPYRHRLHSPRRHFLNGESSHFINPLAQLCSINTFSYSPQRDGE